jgi:hypothetical protein
VLAGTVDPHPGEQFRFGLDRIVPDAAAHEFRQQVDADDDRAERPER